MSRSSKSKLFKHKSNTKIGVLVLSSSPTIVKERLFPKKLKHSRIHCSFDITVPSSVIPENWNNSWTYFWIFIHTSTVEICMLQYEMGIQWHLKFPNHKFLRFNTIVNLSYFEWSEIFKRVPSHLIVLCSWSLKLIRVEEDFRDFWWQTSCLQTLRIRPSGKPRDRISLVC